MNKKDLSGFIFAIVILLFVLGTWYWVWFKDGAKKWGDGIFQYGKLWGQKYRTIFVHPIFLKFFISLALFVAILFALFAALPLFER